MSPALTLPEFRVLVGLLTEDVRERSRVTERNIGAIDGLAQRGLATLWPDLRLTERGHALIGYMRGIPLPEQRVVWTLPSFRAGRLR